jgi:hypothetical protein
MILYSVNASHIELYLLNYSIAYSVDYTQYNTVTFFSNSTVICFWTTRFWLWQLVAWCIFNKLLLPFFRILMTTYRNALCHNPVDDSSNIYQSTNSKFNLTRTIFIQFNDPPNAHQQNVFHHILLFTDMFRSLLRPSSRCHTRSHNVQIVTQNIIKATLYYSSILCTPCRNKMTIYVVVNLEFICCLLAVYSWYTHWYLSKDIYCSENRLRFGWNSLFCLWRGKNNLYCTDMVHIKWRTFLFVYKA